MSTKQGSEKNRSTIDQIFTIGQILDKRIDKRKDTHILFIDFTKSYDCLIRTEIWNAMLDIGIPKKLVNMTKICTNDSTNKVRISGNLSNEFHVETGVKQGDGLSP